MIDVCPHRLPGEGRQFDWKGTKMPRQVARYGSVAVVSLLVSCAQPQPQQHTIVDSAGGAPPSGWPTTATGVLDKSLSLPGMRGALSVHVTSAGSSHEVPDGGGTTVVTDYRARVTGLFGSPSHPFHTNAEIVLRLPGGTTATKTVDVEEIPRLTKDHDFLVWIYDAPATAGSGPDQAGVVRLINSGYVAPVARGIVTINGHTLSLTDAEAHLTRHPATR